MTEMVGRRFRFGKIILIVIAILLALVADDQIETWMAKEYYPIYHQEVPPKADTLILNPK